MRVIDIATTNLHIMQGIAQDYSKLSSLPAEIDNILSRVVIRYVLDSVNPFELLGLQKVGCVLSILPMDVSKDDLQLLLEETRFTPDSTSDEVLLQKAIGVNNFMAYNDCKEFNSIRKVGPVGLQQYKCNVILKGSSILNLYGYNFSQIFELPENETMSLESFIEAKLVAGLMSATYSNIQNILISKDVYTNAWYFENFYRGRNKEYTLMSIFDNEGNTIKFVDTTPDVLKASISLSKKTNGDYPDREWIIEVVCDTPIYMYFFYLFTNLGMDKKFNIVNVEDMMIILNKERRSSDLIDNEYTDKVSQLSMKDNIKATIRSYDGWFDSCMEREKFDLFSRFLFAPANAKIRYTMHLKWYPDIVRDYKQVLVDLFERFDLEKACPKEYEFLNILNQVNNLILNNDFSE